MIRERAVARPSRVAARVREEVGPDAVRLEDGLAVAAPGGAGEASELIGLAAAEGWRISPAGAGLGPEGPATRGARRPRPDLVLSSERMTRPLDHLPDDFNVAVGAGVTLGALASRLAPEGQWLALDPPGGGGVSVGGVVADGRAGPLGALFGRPRDLLLGLTLVDGAGRILRLGGRVVKNVAGFDLVRLVAGSRGGLGMITEATFRLHPLPAEDLTLVWARADAHAAWELGRRLAALRAPLAAAEIVAGEWPEPLGAGPARLLLRLMGSASASRQIARLLEAEAGKPDEEWAGGASAACFRALSEGEGLGSGAGWAFSAPALPARGGELLSAFSGVACRRLALGLLGGTFRGYPPDSEAASAARVAAARIGTPFAGPGAGWAHAPGGSRRSARARLASRIVAGFDPSGILPGVWREGRAQPSGTEG